MLHHRIKQKCHSLAVQGQFQVGHLSSSFVLIWSTRSDSNRRTRDLQSPPLGHSGTCAFYILKCTVSCTILGCFVQDTVQIMFGSGGGNRTPTNGFGDRRTAIILHRNI